MRCVSAHRPPQNALRRASFRGPERWESEGAKSKLQGDEKEQNLCVDFCGEVVVSVLWYSVGTLLVEFVKRGATINSGRYAQTLKKLNQRIRRV